MCAALTRDSRVPESQTAPVVRHMDWRRDAEAVTGFQVEIYERNFPGFRVTPFFLHAYRRDMKRALRSPDEALYVVEDEGQAAGFLWIAVIATMVDARVGYVKNLYVAPHLRGQGWAQRLLAVADQWFRGQGVARAELDASVCNPRAVATYEEWGYQATRLRMSKDL